MFVEWLEKVTLDGLSIEEFKKIYNLLKLF